MSGKSSIREMFFEECEELLEALTEGLSALENNAHDDDVINAVFRAVHSIKGGAGAFALDDLVSFAHTFETVLDQLRSKELALDPDLMRIFHKSGDQLCDLVEASRDETACDTVTRDAVIRDLEGYLGDVSEDDIAFEMTPLSFDAAPLEDLDSSSVMSDLPAMTPNTFRIRLSARHDMYAHGHEPLHIINQLFNLGTVDITL
ncbi:MAG: Hpt domain-containing protein, partial [Primorskyibacter sp.]